MMGGFGKRKDEEEINKNEKLFNAIIDCDFMI